MESPYPSHEIRCFIAFRVADRRWRGENAVINPRSGGIFPFKCRDPVRNAEKDVRRRGGGGASIAAASTLRFESTDHRSQRHVEAGLSSLERKQCELLPISYNICLFQITNLEFGKKKKKYPLFCHWYDDDDDMCVFYDIVHWILSCRCFSSSCNVTQFSSCEFCDDLCWFFWFV